LREAIPSYILITNKHSNCFIATLQIAVIHSRTVATSEIKCNILPKSSLIICINMPEF